MLAARSRLAPFVVVRPRSACCLRTGGLCANSGLSARLGIILHYSQSIVERTTRFVRSEIVCVHGFVSHFDEKCSPDETAETSGRIPGVQ